MYPKVCISGLLPLTTRSDQDVTSLEIIHTLPCKQVTRKLKPYHVEVFILILYQILTANLQGNV